MNWLEKLAAYTQRLIMVGVVLVCIALLVWTPSRNFIFNSFGTITNTIRIETSDLETAAPRIGQISQTLRYRGTVIDHSWKIVNAEIEGCIEAIHAKAGMDVKFEDVLVEIGNRRIEINLEKISSLLSIKELEFSRFEETFEQAKKLEKTGAVSAKKRAEAETAMKIKQQELSIARLDHELTSMNIQGRKVRAPYDGRIKNLHAKETDCVKPGFPLYTISDPRFRLIQVFLEIDDSDRIPFGYEATVYYGLQSEERWKETVSMKATRVSGNGLIEVHLKTDSMPDDLIIGRKLNVDFDVSSGKDALIIPNTALVLEGAKKFLFANTGSKIEKRAVETGFQTGQEVEIVTGLEANEEVITNPIKAGLIGQN